ncbi:aquaporin [Gluconacetobacter azotocaptans]|uniref:MIP/aquaporin family protein n=1 Tax=Gluconacetobacter azotocaptans TaxID=142834 RepID=UPI00195AA0AF|nr:aquaporin [Gluconacetobacter azotocaptans]MBM9402024.1 aquaporin [Gluconacetobacter azotocaptans]
MTGTPPPPSAPVAAPVDNPALYPHPQDRPLAGAPHPGRLVHPRLYACECAGTIVLMIFGVATNVLLGAAASPVGRVLADYPALQVALQGLFFGMGGSIAALSPFGRVSGGHVSPSVTLAFTLAGRLAWRDMIGYMAGQLAGAVIGTGLVALAGLLWPRWGGWAGATHFAATVPYDRVPLSWAFTGEACTTALLITALLFTGGHARLRWATPLLAGPLFFTLNPFEAWLSGDSTNLARSLGPALFSGQWQGFWIYCVAPFLGAAATVLMMRLQVFGEMHLHEARIAHFGHHGRAPFLLPWRRNTGA